MTARFDALTHPDKAGADHRAKSKHRPVAFVLAFSGMMLAVVTLIANIAAANTDSATGAGETLAWSFGVTVFGISTIMLAISLILIGVLVRLWFRVTAISESLPGLKADSEAPAPQGNIKTKWGAATETAEIPGPTKIHTMAKTLWFPMIAMGYMLVMVGAIFSFIWLSKVDDGTSQAIQAWTAGTQFLGETFLLGGISFLLGSIVAALRKGGGEVQKSLGLPVRTLKMPATAKAFVGLMMMGMMAGMLQFVLYIVAAAVSANTFASWLAWLGPLRELSLGLLLSGIVLALITIGNVLEFQFDRIVGIIKTGR